MDQQPCDIITLAGKFKTHSEIQEYCNKQFDALTVAAKKIKELEEQVSHLKNLLITTTNITQSNDPTKIIITPEERICDAQILLLESIAMHQPLTLEEVKILDLLVKNKKIIKEQSLVIETESKPVKSVLPKADLVRLASKLDKEEEI